jgi:hypothetical protein
MDIKLNIEDDNQSSQPITSNRKKDKGFALSSLNEFEISRAIAKLGAQGRPLILPIGFPGAGKSLLLSSLFWYAQEGRPPLYHIEQRGDIKEANQEGDSYFVNGKTVLGKMVETFSKGNLFERNAVGALDLIGVDIIPSKHESKPSKFPKLPLSFLDLSGEDILKIKTSEDGEFGSKINAIFKGVQLDNSPLIFFLITPFDPRRESGQTLEDAHRNEDFLHFDFLNYINTNQPQLLKNSIFIIIVSQWDKNTTYKDAEDFIREKRKSVYGFVKNSTVVWGEYSVGKILQNEVNGVIMEEILNRNEDYPSRLWKMLYKICTKRDLDYKTFWQKLFS